MNIDLRGIHKHFGSVHANNDINMSLSGGQIVGVVGENGAGKSTLMRILSGFLAADEGEIWIDGEHIRLNSPPTAIAHGIGMLHQDPLDVGAFTALENFMFGASRRFMPNRHKAKERLTHLMHHFRFELEPDAPISALSLAQRQQLEIVRLLALGAHTLILDEPTTGISATQRVVLFDALRDLAKDEQGLVVLVSHKLDDAISLCDKVYVLRAGRVIGSLDMPASPAELVTMMFGERIKPPARTAINRSQSPNALCLEGITVRGQRITVANLSLSVRVGEVVGLAGLEGSGQEPVMRAAVGLKDTVQGRVRVGLKDMTHGSFRSFANEGVAFSGNARANEGLIDGLTLAEHMALVQEKGLWIDWERARRQMDTLIRRYRVRGQPTNRIDELSGGNKQRVLMALLPAKPVALILENPTRGLDAQSAGWVWSQLLDRCTAGACIMFSSSDLDELVTYSDRILVFFAGHVVEVPDACQTSTIELGRLIGGQVEETNYKRLA